MSFIEEYDRTVLEDIGLKPSEGGKRHSHGVHNEDIVAYVLSKAYPHSDIVRNESSRIKSENGSLTHAPDITVKDGGVVKLHVEVKTYMDMSMLKRTLFEAYYQPIETVIVAFENSLPDEAIRFIEDTEKVSYFCLTPVNRRSTVPRYKSLNTVNLEKLNELEEYFRRRK